MSLIPSVIKIQLLLSILKFTIPYEYFSKIILRKLHNIFLYYRTVITLQLFTKKYYIIILVQLYDYCISIDKDLFLTIYYKVINYITVISYDTLQATIYMYHFRNVLNINRNDLKCETQVFKNVWCKHNHKDCDFENKNLPSSSRPKTYIKWYKLTKYFICNIGKITNA